MRNMGSEIMRVVSGSPAELAGIHDGDLLVTLNGQQVRDILDYRYHTADEKVIVEVIRKGRLLRRTIRKSPEEDLGLRFREELFDGVRMCANDCIFCFLKQMPQGLRDSLYIRDDDYRLSFAHGNYVTLTNLSEQDMRRIGSQRISPLYVSVHSTDPDIREFMLGNRRARQIMSQLNRLAGAGIRIHTQIVLCPGINDGEHLCRTIRDLATLHPSVASVALVPVGLTRYRERLPAIRRITSKECEEVLDICRSFQREFRRTKGTRFVFASDEIYILAKEDFPSASAYEGFPQLEDGVGLCRLFIDDMRKVERKLKNSFRRIANVRKYVFVTGTLASDLLGQLACIFNECLPTNCEVRTIENNFFGDSVTVAGLLTGQDIINGLAGKVEPDQTVLIPAVALRDGMFLDNTTLSDLQMALGVPVEIVESMPSAVYHKILSGN